jgi:hypothetical protein
MRFVSWTFWTGVALGAVASVGAAIGDSSRASAQVMDGEFALRQSTVVGWACVSGDRSYEWWAYIDGVYDWADSTSTPASPWDLKAEYMGPGGWSSFDAWKSAVLQRPEAAGKRVVFQRHTVTEETTQN